MRHEVKIWPNYFDDVADRKKTHELRRNDRSYSVGDTMVMREWIPETGTYTGREILAEITHIIERGLAASDRSKITMGLSPGYEILSIDVMAVTANDKR